MKCLMIHILLSISAISYCQNPYFTIGTKWTYETVEIPLPLIFSFVTFQITDTMQFHGKNVFVIEDDHGQVEEYMYVDSSRVYFWDIPTEMFQLTYDFESDSSYTSYWKGCSGAEGEAIIKVDSITSFVLNLDTLYVQHISIENNGSTEEDISTCVYKNIGLKEFGLRLPLGFDVCDFLKQYTQLRCFENNGTSYNFVGRLINKYFFMILNVIE